MQDDDPIDGGVDRISRVTGVVGQMVQIAGDNPDAKEAGKSLARSAAAIATLVENALLPIAVVNYGFKKARQYFEDRFPGDMAEKLSNMSSDDIVEPKPSIAAPALEGLAFSHDEPSLKDMYLNLLVSAMDGRNVRKAHPAFAEIIKQIDGVEAAYLKMYLRRNVYPIARLNENVNARNWVKYFHSFLLHSAETNLPVTRAELPIYVDNWVRLGLVEVDYSKRLSDPGSYDWIESRPEYQNALLEIQEPSTIEVVKGLMRRTDFGAAFAAAVLD